MDYYGGFYRGSIIWFNRCAVRAGANKRRHSE